MIRVIDLKLLLLLTLVCVWCSHARAAAIYLKDSDEPVLGFIKSRTATHLSVLITTDGQRSERLIPVAEIAEVLETVDSNRLAGLDPGKLTEYRDYAEELMVKRADPEARETSLRLFLITAWFGEGDIRSSALRGLVSLARNGEERRRFLALAYRYGAIDLPGKSTSEPSSSVVKEVQLSEKQQAKLATIIRGARTGFSKQVRQQAMESSVKSMFSTNDLGMTYKEFISLISGARIGNDELLALVSLELRSLNRLETGSSGNEDSKIRVSWAQVAAGDESKPIKVLDFTNVTEFNPNACYFFDGKWQESR